MIAGSLRGWLRSVALEEATLLASLGKWTALAVLVGMLGGASTAVFLRVLDRGVALAAAFPYPFVMLPLGFAASVLLVQWLAPQARGHGTEKIIEAVHMRWGRIPFLVAPVKLVATVLTISVGGSVGKEGPAAQIGAALASALASALWLRRDDRRKLVICGISAGFASVFGTPIAGAIFGVEVLVMGSLFYEVVYPSFIAGIVAYQTSIHLGSTYFHQTIGHVPVPGEGIFLQMVGTGIAIGVVAIVMIESLRVADLVAAAIRAPRWLVGAGGGVLLAGLAWLTSPRYLGLGIDTLEQAVTGAPVPVAAFALKIVFTAVSLASGGQRWHHHADLLRGQHGGQRPRRHHGRRSRSLRERRHGGDGGRLGERAHRGLDHGAGAVRLRGRPVRRHRVRGELPRRGAPQRLRQPAPGRGQERVHPRSLRHRAGPRRGRGDPATTPTPVATDASTAAGGAGSLAPSLLTGARSFDTARSLGAEIRTTPARGSSTAPRRMSTRIPAGVRADHAATSSIVGAVMSRSRSRVARLTPWTAIAAAPMSANGIRRSRSVPATRPRRVSR